MNSYLRSRLLSLLPVLLCMTVIVFSIIRLIPGDPALVMLGPRATQESLANLRETLGLDKPLFTQYLRFVSGIFRGDLGTSLLYRKPVVGLIGERLPPTLWLIVYASTLTVLISLPLAAIAALRRDSWIDQLLRSSLVVTFAMPTFWLGIMLLQLFSLKLKLLPVSGWGEGIGGHLRALLLPSLTIALTLSALIIRNLRASILENLQADHVRTARAKGLSERAVFTWHVMRLSLIPAVTIFGLNVGFLIADTVVVEIVFAIPGLGQLLVKSILSRDYPIVQGIVLLFTVLVILINLSTDLINAALDPRVHHG